MHIPLDCFSAAAPFPPNPVETPTETDRESGWGCGLPHLALCQVHDLQHQRLQNVFPLGEHNGHIDRKRLSLEDAVLKSLLILRREHIGVLRFQVVLQHCPVPATHIHNGGELLGHARANPLQPLKQIILNLTTQNQTSH